MPWISIEGFDAQALIDTLPDYVLVIDEDHTVWMANQAVRRQLGVNPEDLIGGHCPSLIHGCSGPFPGCPLEDAVESGHDVEKELTDEKSGMTMVSCIYDTGYRTPEGKKLYLHTAKPKPCK